MFFHRFGGGIEMKGGDGATGGGVDDYDDRQQQRLKGGFVAPEQQLQEQQPKAECYSDEVDSRSGGAESEQPPVRKKRKSSSSAAAVPANMATGGDGATVEVLRRPRGRPPGSKNKPKPPVVITRDANDDPSSPNAMRPHVIEISAGEDVVDALARFSRRRGLGLSVLAGTGLVSNVVLRPNLSFQGHFEILSISATFFPPPFAPSPPSVLRAGGGGCGDFSVTLAGPQGQIFGGLVAGPLTAAGSLTILAATFGNPTYHRLPAEDSIPASVSGGGDVETARGLTTQAQSQPRRQHDDTSRQYRQRQQPPHQQQQQERSSSPPSSSDAPAATAAAQHFNHHHHLHHPAAAVASPVAAESCGMSIYGGHLPSDVIWAPAARSPPY